MGSKAAAQLLADVADGAYQLAPFDRHDVQAAAAVLQRFDDLGIGLTDASLVVLADRHQTGRVLSFDERPSGRCGGGDGDRSPFCPPVPEPPHWAKFPVDWPRLPRAPISGTPFGGIP